MSLSHWFDRFLRKKFDSTVKRVPNLGFEPVSFQILVYFSNDSFEWIGFEITPTTPDKTENDWKNKSQLNSMFGMTGDKSADVNSDALLQFMKDVEKQKRGDDVEPTKEKKKSDKRKPEKKKRKKKKKKEKEQKKKYTHTHIHVFKFIFF